MASHDGEGFMLNMEHYQKIEQKIDQINAEVSIVTLILSEQSLSFDLYKQGEKALTSLNEALLNLAKELSSENELEAFLLKKIDENIAEIDSIFSMLFSMSDEKEKDKKGNNLELRNHQKEELLKQQLKEQEEEERAQEEAKKIKQKIKIEKLKEKYPSQFMALLEQALAIESANDLHAARTKYNKLYLEFNGVASKQDEEQLLQKLKERVNFKEEFPLKDVDTFFITLFDCYQEKFSSEKTFTWSVPASEEAKIETEKEEIKGSVIENNQTSQQEVPVFEKESVAEQGEDMALVEAEKKLRQHMPDIISGALEQRDFERKKQIENFKKYCRTQLEKDTVVNPQTKKVSPVSFFANLKQLGTSAIKTVTTSMQQMADLTSEFKDPNFGK